MNSNKTIKAMKKALQKSGYPLTISGKSSGKGLVAEVNGNKLKARLLADYDPASKEVRMTLYFRNQPPEETRDILYGTLNAINLSLPFGYFCVCPHSGEIIMQSSYFITGDFDPAKFRLTVGGFLGEAVMNYPSIKGRIFSEPASA